jgi:hypothetical protein
MVFVSAASSEVEAQSETSFKIAFNKNLKTTN